MNHYRRVLKQRTDLDRKCRELEKENQELKYENQIYSDWVEAIQFKNAIIDNKLQEVIVVPDSVLDEIRIMKDAEKESRLIPA